MRQILRFLLAGLCASLMGYGVQAGDVASPLVKPKPSEGATCGDYGTNVHFEKTPSIAARKALKEEKLVMVLHVSGLFEDSEFT